MTKNQLLTLAAALSAASLTACSGSDREPAPVEKDEGAPTPSRVEEPTPAPSAAEIESPPSARETPAANDSVAEVPSEEAPAPDEQMMDDAAATGMTARTTRADPAAEQPTPAEQREKK
jgi:hypothetical protein